MDLPHIRYHFSPSALTRTVQSIISPCLYTGSPYGLSAHSLPSQWRSITVKTEDTVKMEKNEITKGMKTDDEETPMLMDSYSEIVDKVARNDPTDEKPRVKRLKKRIYPKLKKSSKKNEIVVVKVKKRRLCANRDLLEAPLLVKEHLSTFQSNGRDQMWWFVLKVLMDPSNRHIVAWTGQYYSFRVIDKELFTKMWCEYNYRCRIIAWSSVCRSMRLCYGDKGILTPVSQRERIWAFVVDISIPLMISRESIQEFIDEHKQIPPNSMFFDGNRSMKLESTNDSKMKDHSTYTPNVDSPHCELESMSLLPPSSPSPLIFSPLKLDFSNRPPLTSPLFWTDTSTTKSSTSSPLPSPYWLPVPTTPMFSSFFHF